MGGVVILFNVAAFGRFLFSHGTNHTRHPNSAWVGSFQGDRTYNGFLYPGKWVCFSSPALKSICNWRKEGGAGEDATDFLLFDLWEIFYEAYH
jgi:hypothetical protein